MRGELRVTNEGVCVCEEEESIKKIGRKMMKMLILGVGLDGL